MILSALSSKISFVSAYRRRAWLLLVLFLTCLFLAGCSDDAEEGRELISDYGIYGETIAMNLALQFPLRKAYSAEERAAGQFIKKEFEALGYSVEETSFFSSEGGRASYNYSVRVEGTGFMTPDTDGNYKKTRRTVIVGAHYDTVYGVDDKEEAGNFSGIHDNAAGIGALLSIAKELKTEKALPYDVILVAFGAGAPVDTEPAGARSFLLRMTMDERASVDAMYCIDGIYAGDKLYASAGWNSLEKNMKYEKRRKLYEFYDVVYEYMLSSPANAYSDIYYNQSGLTLDVNGDGTEDVYREVTLTRSDYAPFDDAGIPIVFVESFDYNYSSVEAMKETKNLLLQEHGGFVRNTKLDSTTPLAKAFESKRLENRINAVAFSIVKAIVKGSHDSVSVPDYEAGQRVAETVSVTSVTSVARPGQTTAASTSESTTEIPETTAAPSDEEPETDD